MNIMYTEFTPRVFRGVRVSHCSFCVVLVSVFMFWVLCCDVRYDFRIKTTCGCLYLQLFVGWLMSYLRYSCMFAHSGVQHILCCVFVLFFFVVLPVSLDCPFLIAAWIFIYNSIFQIQNFIVQFVTIMQIIQINM